MEIARPAEKLVLAFLKGYTLSEGRSLFRKPPFWIAIFRRPSFRVDFAVMNPGHFPGLSRRFFPAAA